MTLCSHLINRIKKKKQHAWFEKVYFEKVYFEKYLSLPPVITWVSSSVAPFTLHCRQVFNNSLNNS